MKGFSLLSKVTGKLNYARYNSTSAKMKSGGHYDIIISGGGMVGFAMACSLGIHNFSIKIYSQNSNLLMTIQAVVRLLPTNEFYF